MRREGWSRATCITGREDVEKLVSDTHTETS